MSQCLAFDASTEACSVAYFDGTDVFALHSREPRSHANKLLSFTEQLLSEHQTDCSKLDFIACSNGPGSFTGLRIGCSVAQGLAFATGLPLIGVSSLETLAASVACERSSPAGRIIITAFDARMNELYWAAYQEDPNGRQTLISPCVGSATSLEQYLESLSSQNNPHLAVTLAGSGAPLIDLSSFNVELLQLDVLAEATPTAEQVARLAHQSWLQGNKSRAEELQIEYLRNSVAWEKRKRIRGD